MGTLDRVWQRFARYWLPEAEATGDLAADVSRTLGRTYENITRENSVARFNSKGGFCVVAILPEHTLVLANAKPVHQLPKWVEQYPGVGPEARRRRQALRKGLLANPRPHLVIEPGNTMVDAGDLFDGDASCLVICRPGDLVAIRPKQVARAHDAFVTLGTKTRARALLTVLARRERDGPSESTNTAVLEIAAAADLTLPQLFDAVEALTAVTGLERQLAQT